MDLMPEPATLLLPFRKTPLNGMPPLRVGVVLDVNQSAPWADSLIAFLGQIPGLDIRVLTVASRGQSESKRPGWLMDRLYSASRARFDPFGEIALNGTGSAVPESVDAIRAAACEVIVWLGHCQDPDVELRSLAKYGVVTARFGEHNRPIPFWDEVAQNSLTSTAAVFWHDSSFTEGRQARKAETNASRGLLITPVAQQPLIAVMRMIAALCIEIQYDGLQFEERVRRLPTQHLPDVGQQNCPSNLDTARYIVKKLAWRAHLELTTRGKILKWFIAMRPNSGRSITDPAMLDLTGFKEIPLPAGVCEMADPFLWEAGGRQYLLFEEVAVGQARGRLACCELSRDGSCSEMKIILERPYHLSYPCVVPQHGELFLLPETAEANRVDLYRFSRFPWEVELVASPVSGAALVDTTPVFVEGQWYFFTTTIEPFVETLLFSSPRLEGPWNLHPVNPVSSSVRSCRSAGQLFWKDGRLFRPTQDCSVQYGYAISVNEITRLTPYEFEERSVSYVSPRGNPNL